MTKESRQKLTLAVLVIGGMIYAYLNYAFWPKYIDIQEQRGTINQELEHLHNLQSVAQNKEPLSANVRALEEQYADLKAQIPPFLDKPQLIVYFYNLSAKYNLTNGQLQFEESGRQGSYTKLTMTYSASGLVSDILKFIDALQSGKDPRITVQSVSVNPGLENANLTLKLTGYAEKLEANSNVTLDFMNSPFGVAIPEGIGP